MAEEGDLELARELLGAKEEMADNSGINFKPQTKEDFKTLRKHIINVGNAWTVLFKNQSYHLACLFSLAR